LIRFPLRIASLVGEAGLAGSDGVGKLPGAPVLFGELRERNRRRILLGGRG
jgi:hypothetical protein